MVDRDDVTSAVGEGFDAVLTAAQMGADWAVARLYRSLQPALLRYLGSRAGGEGEDIAAQVWLEVAGGLRAFRGDEAAFRRWVFSLGHRRLIDHIRARARRPVDAVPAHVLAHHPAGADPATEAVEAVAGARAVARVAELLPHDLAEVVLLRVVAGLSAEEVGEILGVPAGTVRVQQHRALRRLAEALASPDARL